MDNSICCNACKNWFAECTCIQQVQSPVVAVSTVEITTKKSLITSTGIIERQQNQNYRPGTKLITVEGKVTGRTRKSYAQTRPNPITPGVFPKPLISRNQWVIPTIFPVIDYGTNFSIYLGSGSFIANNGKILGEGYYVNRVTNIVKYKGYAYLTGYFSETNQTHLTPPIVFYKEDNFLFPVGSEFGSVRSIGDSSNMSSFFTIANTLVTTPYYWLVDTADVKGPNYTATFGSTTASEKSLVDGSVTVAPVTTTGETVVLRWVKATLHIYPEGAGLTAITLKPYNTYSLMYFNPSTGVVSPANLADDINYCFVIKNSTEFYYFYNSVNILFNFLKRVPQAGGGFIYIYQSSYSFGYGEEYPAQKIGSMTDLPLVSSFVADAGGVNYATIYLYGPDIPYLYLPYPTGDVAEMPVLAATTQEGYTVPFRESSLTFNSLTNTANISGYTGSVSAFCVLRTAPIPEYLVEKQIVLFTNGDNTAMFLLDEDNNIINVTSMFTTVDSPIIFIENTIEQANYPTATASVVVSDSYISDYSIKEVYSIARWHPWRDTTELQWKAINKKRPPTYKKFLEYVAIEANRLLLPPEPTQKLAILVHKNGVNSNTAVFSGFSYKPITKYVKPVAVLSSLFINSVEVPQLALGKLLNNLEGWHGNEWNWPKDESPITLMGTIQATFSIPANLTVSENLSYFGNQFTIIGRAKFMESPDVQWTVNSIDTKGFCKFYISIYQSYTVALGGTVTITFNITKPTKISSLVLSYE